MAENNNNNGTGNNPFEDQSVFFRISRLLRGGKDVTGELRNRSRGLLNDNPGATNNYNTPDYIEQKQQDFLDFQSIKIAKDIYTKSLYYETDRLTANQDFRAMDMSPEISAALDIIADEICAKGENNKMLTIFSENDRVKKILQDLFYKVLNIQFNLRSWSRELIKYGDLFLHLLVDKELGIHNVQLLPISEMQREEGYDGNLNSVRFRWTTQNEFFEHWQIAHFRILSDSMRLPFGRSILDPARKIWKQLQLATDAMLVYRLCLHGETRIRTNNGYKYIKDIKVGDTVYSYNTNKELVETKVINQVNNGKKKLFKVSSKHIEFIGTATHPVLVNRNGIIQYVDIQDLKIKQDKLINVQFETDNKIEIPRFFGEEHCKLSDDGRKVYRLKRESCLTQTGKIFHTTENTNAIQSFLYTEGCTIPKTKAIEACEELGIDTNLLIDCNKGEINPERINLPKYVDEEFAQLFGFIIGDGYVRENGNELTFAGGTDKIQNEKYAAILKKYFGKVSFYPEKRIGYSNGAGNYTVHSTIACKIFLKMGYIYGAHNKRIPSWVFTAPKNIRRAFIIGLSNADGHERFTKKGTWQSIIELCNKKLVEDIKEVWSSIGLSTGHVTSRKRKGGHVIDKSTGRKMKDTICHCINISELEVPEYENILQIEAVKSENVYDISVSSKEHNFVGNGTILHNTRAPDRKVFYIEVGNIDPNDVEQYVAKINAQIRKQPVVDQRNGQMNLKYDPMPIWKNTPIPLLDGRTLTIEELAKEHEMGKQNYVYSVQDTTHKIVSGKITWCGKNYTAKQLTKVWLDDNTWILTAPEHPFVLRNGEIKRADELQNNDSLMPFYEDKVPLYANKSKNKKYTYHRTYNPFSNNFEFTHRLIASEISKQNDNFNTVHHNSFDRYNNNPDKIEWTDFNAHKKMHGELSKKMWEDPKHRENISIKAKKLWENKEYKNKMAKHSSEYHKQKWKDHEYRKSHIFKVAKKMKEIWSKPEMNAKRKDFANRMTPYAKTEKRSKIVSENNIKRNSTQHFKWYNGSDLHKQHNKIRKDVMIKKWEDPYFKENIAKHNRITLSKKCFDIMVDEIQKFKHFINVDNFILHLKSTELYTELVMLNQDANRTIRNIDKFFNHRKNVRLILRQNGIETYNEFLEKYNKDLLLQKKKMYSDKTIAFNKTRNHKVLRIENIVVDGEDVYCMTVVGLNNENDRHNFAVYSIGVDGNKSGSGVFVKNTISDDILIPVRNEKGCKVETLAGACLALDTKIPLLDGRTLTLQEIITEFNEGKKLETYSINPSTGEIVPGEITWAGITRKNTDVIKITLDNGENITCTPDHKFPLRSGELIQAKDLNNNNELWGFVKNEIGEVWDDEICAYTSSSEINSKKYSYDENIITEEKDYFLGFEQKSYVKIVSIENLSNKIDTGTITIDGNEKYHNFHNFALSNGIFTQNSNMNDIADVTFLENKLFSALKVPKAYLNYTETLQGGSTLSQADLRFSRTINSYQDYVLIELRRIAQIHLILLGFEDDIDNFDLKLANPSTQQELLKLEVMKARIEVYKEFVTNEPSSPYSATYGAQNILGLSLNEIKLNFRQKKIEKKFFTEIDGAPEEYNETGLFYDMDKKFRKAGFIPNQAPKQDGEGGDDAGGGGFGGGGSVLGGGGLGGDMGGGGMGNDMGDAGGIPPGGGGLEGGSSVGLGGLENQPPPAEDDGTDATAATGGDDNEENPEPLSEVQQKATENKLIYANRRMKNDVDRISKEIDSKIKSLTNNKFIYPKKDNSEK